MTLLSDSSMNMFPSNMQSEFTVKLDHPIEIDEETWEVALAEIATHRAFIVSGAINC